MEKDDLFRQALNIEDFIFDESVSRVFDDMVDRSVPAYRSLIANIAVIASAYLQPGTNCYDLGSSHANCLLSVWRTNPDVDCSFIGVDQSSAMVSRSQQKIRSEHANDTVTVHCADIVDFPLSNASVIILNLTLQFIQPARRNALINRIYASLVKGGVLILSEKISMPTPPQETLFDQLHTLFKKQSGYSNLEISQKRKALEKVLIKDSEQQHMDRLESAGFQQAYRWFQCYNFISLLAIK